MAVDGLIQLAVAQLGGSRLRLLVCAPREAGADSARQLADLAARAADPFSALHARALELPARMVLLGDPGAEATLALAPGGAYDELDPCTPTEAARALSGELMRSLWFELLLELLAEGRLDLPPARTALAIVAELDLPLVARKALREAANDLGLARLLILSSQEAGLAAALHEGERAPNPASPVEGELAAIAALPARGQAPAFSVSARIRLGGGACEIALGERPSAELGEPRQFAWETGPDLAAQGALQLIAWASLGGVDVRLTPRWHLLLSSDGDATVPLPLTRDDDASVAAAAIRCEGSEGAPGLTLLAGVDPRLPARALARADSLRLERPPDGPLIATAELRPGKGLRWGVRRPDGKAQLQAIPIELFGNGVLAGS